MFDGKQPGQAIGKPTKEQAEIARLKRQLADRERDLETTQTALDIRGSARALGAALQERGFRRSQAQQHLKDAYAQLSAANGPTRQTQTLTGVSPATMHRAAMAQAQRGTGENYLAPRPEPTN